MSSISCHLNGLPNSPVAETPVSVTVALASKLKVPTEATKLGTFSVLNLLSVCVVVVPKAEVPACPVGV